MNIRCAAATEATAATAKIADQVGNAQFQAKISVSGDGISVCILALLIPASSIFNLINQIAVFNVIGL